MITDVYRRNNPYVKTGASFIGFSDLCMYWGRRSYESWRDCLDSWKSRSWEADCCFLVQEYVNSQEPAFDPILN
jgi:hypothetical protein